MDREILDRCVLFQGLDNDELSYAMDFFHAREQRFLKGDRLNRVGEPLRRFGLLISGSIHVSMDDFDGNHLLMASVTPGITFGEALCYLGVEAQVSIESMVDSKVLMMDTVSLRSPTLTPTPMDHELAKRFTAMLARRSLGLNDRIQILSKRTIREKVVTLLSQYVARDGSDRVVLPFGREAMATYLGVNQSALSRELSRMQEDGIIRYNGRQFDII